MTNVVANMSVSLDGFIADTSDGVEHVFAWYNAGSVPVRLPDESNPAEPTEPAAGARVSEASARLLAETWSRVRVLVAGRRTFDMSNGWNGSPPLGLPTIVVTHQVPAGWKDDGNPFTFVTEGVESAIAKAKTIAGDGIVAVSGANITQQCINAALLDEISIDLVPVLLGDGIRYLDRLTNTPVKLEDPEVVEGIGVTHLTYRISRT